MPVIDVRSDIVTRPSEAMLEAMLQSGQQPRQYGYREDADLKKLESLVAETFDKEDALFLPTCTMANQIALMAQCPRGANFVVDAHAHINNFEVASTVGIAGAVPRVIADYRGHPLPDALDEALAMNPTSLFWLENTHNRAGGTVLSPQKQSELVSVCRKYGVPTHVDGARIWNAAAALGCAVADLTWNVDSVSASLNKGLGVPVGAVLAGSRQFIRKAEQLQITLGGGWRPTGIIAAAGVVALEDLSLDELLADHKAARHIATELFNYEWLRLDLELVRTNIILVSLGDEVSMDLVAELRERGVLVTPAGKHRVRLVTYRQIREKEVSGILDAFADLNQAVNAGKHAATEVS